MVFPNDADITGRFSQWSEETGLQRFWGIGKTGNNVCLVLPTLSENFRSVIIEADEVLWLVDGYSSEPLNNNQYELGPADTTSPGDALRDIAEWSLGRAEASFELGKFGVCAQRAHVAARIGHYIADPVLEERSEIIKEAALSQ
jgi:hypothetical protein